MGSTGRRVAVTGIGVVSAFGVGAKVFWEALVDGRSALHPLGSAPGGLGELNVAQVDLSGVSGVPDSDHTTAMLALAAAEAIAQGNLERGADGHRRGVAAGTCQGVRRGAGDGDLPMLMTRHVADMFTRPVDVVARLHGLTGPRAVLSTACASGATTLGWAYDQIRADRADVMLAGGTEALLLYGLAGFHGLRVTSPGRSVAYARSDGMCLGEGAAILLLEEWEHARRRRATVLAEFLAWGSSADAYHPVAPDPSGRGALAAVRAALRTGGIGPSDVDYVNGHGTGTANNDAMEKEIMSVLFGNRAGAVPISSIKPAVGHGLGAAGAVEAAACVLAVHHGVIPPTAGATGPVDGLDIVPGQGRPAPVRIALSTSYAFGGNNAALVFSAPTRPATAPPGRPVGRAVTITGVATLPADAGDLPRPGAVPTSVWRRMDRFTRHALLTAVEALADAGIDAAADRDRAALMFATGSGPLQSIEAFGRSLSDELVPARRADFPGTIFSVPTGTLNLCLDMRGPTATFISGGTGGLQALAHAADLVARGEASYALVVGADERTDALCAAHRRWWGADGPQLPECTIAVVIAPADTDADGYRMIGGFGQAGSAAPEAAGPDAATFAAAMTAALASTAGRPGFVVPATTAGCDLRPAEAAALDRLFPDGLAMIGADRPDPTAALSSVVTAVSHPADSTVDAVLVNALAVGGAAASLVLRRPPVR